MIALPRLLIFDLDGTLVDSREDIASACNYALTTHGRDALTRDQIGAFVGDGARVLIARAFGLDATSKDVDAPLADFHAFYTENATRATALIAGVREALLTFADHESKPKLAVCTNKPRATSERVLAAKELASYFGFLYCGGDGPLKPDPHGIRACCTHFGFEPKDAWMIGDGPQDITAGKNAGSHTVGISTEIFVTRAMLLRASPDACVATFDELVVLFVSASR